MGCKESKPRGVGVAQCVYDRHRSRDCHRKTSWSGLGCVAARAVSCSASSSFPTTQPHARPAHSQQRVLITMHMTFAYGPSARRHARGTPNPGAGVACTSEADARESSRRAACAICHRVQMLSTSVPVTLHCHHATYLVSNLSVTPSLCCVN